MKDEQEISVSRQGLERGDLHRMIAQSGWGHLLLDERQLAQSLASVRPPDDACWVFAYGSLLWNPLFDPVERRDARLAGYHRRFCFWIHAGRASPGHPGLMMGLMPGGTCRGQVLRIAPDRAAEELSLLWRREMVTGAYAPRLLPVATPQGVVRAVTFVANSRHPTFAGALAPERVAAAVAAAEGPLGRNSDYLWRTVDALRRLGIPDQGLERVARHLG
ncbi:gamma-glutamylcyclotransferase [Magnetospirillum aberrantis]|uniref:glutathione-specific gamma-glutamylcyclotransferase n=1 Tax=Magnetospirillum aberrantis SpK TaxID=908842 RepID=A0A7C9QSR6_9PROT|nr:gamma-glutamylcyclotransferase [Magnetospirillum aberrantis]NFV79584.1 gamma-glutamylcyclotransferase [Magnetospirillum aberrantis SpK]